MVNIKFCEKYRLGARYIASDIKNDLRKKAGIATESHYAPPTEIRYSIKELAKKMGPEFTDKHPTLVYFGLKYGLYAHNLFADRKEGGNIVVRFKKGHDVLPESLEYCLQELEVKRGKRGPKRRPI